eukprot:CAMPEP_0119313840 /NCGR_PEP_ID=MMETSP1333-20130426/30604_1 /TAXON_ID=418940 /ORGANISM="Scyphosphaera apsteinii, Strain RCC1455" /LENGTH=105 /DNA_ID=CAMNT_0007318799 /DNA_START=486 /DNA_END=800 /DNA_ORIENTATION=-
MNSKIIEVKYGCVTLRWRYESTADVNKWLRSSKVRAQPSVVRESKIVTYVEVLDRMVGGGDDGGGGGGGDGGGGGGGGGGDGGGNGGGGGGGGGDGGGDGGGGGG